MSLADLLADARSLDGLTADPADPEARARYCDLVGVDECGASYVDASGCALVVLALWRRAGCRHPLLDAPTRDRHAFGDVLDIARAAGALHGPERIPQQGDVVMVGDLGPGDPLHGRAGGPGHVWTVIEAGVEEGVTVGLDGGQRSGAHQAIRIRVHQVRDGHDWAPSSDPGGGAIRVVRYVIDGGAVLAALG